MSARATDIKDSSQAAALIAAVQPVHHPARAGVQKLDGFTTAAGVLSDTAMLNGEMLLLRRKIAARLLEGIVAARSRMAALQVCEFVAVFQPIPNVKLRLRFEERGVRTRLVPTMEAGCNLIHWCWDELKLSLFKLGYLPGPMVVAATPRPAERSREEAALQIQPVRSLASNGTVRNVSPPARASSERTSGARVVLSNGRFDFSWCRSTGD